MQLLGYCCGKLLHMECHHIQVLTCLRFMIYWKKDIEWNSLKVAPLKFMNLWEHVSIFAYFNFEGLSWQFRVISKTENIFLLYIVRLTSTSWHRTGHWSASWPTICYTTESYWNPKKCCLVLKYWLNFQKKFACLIG